MKKNLLRYITMGVLLSLVTTSLAVGQGEEDSVYINPKFLKELDNAFTIQAPTSAKITTIEAEKPDRAMLREWVKPDDVKACADRMPLAIDIPGLSAEDLKKAAYMWYSSKYKVGVLQNAPNAISGLDVKGFLTRHLTAKGRQLAASRKLAEDSRVTMDANYPIFQE